MWYNCFDSCCTLICGANHLYKSVIELAGTIKKFRTKHIGNCSRNLQNATHNIEDKLCIIQTSFNAIISK